MRFNGSGSVLSVSFIGLSLSLSNSIGVRVNSQHLSGVSQGILLLDVVSDKVGSNGSNDSLDFIRVNDSRNVSVGHDGSFHVVSRFLLSSRSVGSENGIKRGNGRLGPDDESSQLTAWGEGSQVESVDVGDFDSWDVSEGFD